MVVQHNLTAMNSSRMLGITTGQQAKASEKLSSGYQINRAADDAAGLSISEKMRKQIKGLDRSSMNAQDGVSSVQTAEGALAEVHSMLQRMNELSIQAANGTNSKDDRDAIQSEISQLSTEIDRVAETTKFNETYLLKGSEPLTRHYPKAHDAGLKGKLTDASTTGTFEIPTFWPDDKMTIGAVEYTIGSSKEDAANLINEVAVDVEKYRGLAESAHDKYLDYASLASQNAPVPGNPGTPANEPEYTEYGKLRDQYATLKSAYSTLATEKRIVIGENTYIPKMTFSNAPAKATVSWYEATPENPTGTLVANFPESRLPVPSNVAVEYTTVNSGVSSDDVVAEAQREATAFAATGKTAGTVATNYANRATADPDYAFYRNTLAPVYAELENAYAALVGEKQILVGDKTYTAEYTPGTTPAVTWTEYFSGKTTNNVATTEIPVKASARVLYETVRLNIMTDEEPTGEGDGVDDNIPTLITARKAYENILRELTAANNIGTTAQEATVQYKISEIDRKVSFAIAKGFAEVNSDLSFGLHVGSDADMTNKIQVDIATMNTANLGIEGMNVSDETGLAATYAIDAITDALAIVSEQRSSLGAIQNRLEHTIANLDNVVENTTDAESRIRDTDMAEAMVEYSKNNILAQAGQAMLAQANQSTQGVLSLLQ